MKGCPWLKNHNDWFNKHEGDWEKVLTLALNPDIMESSCHRTMQTPLQSHQTSKR